MRLTLHPRLAPWARRARTEIGVLAALLGVTLAAYLFLNLASEVGEGDTRGFDVRVLYALRSPGDPTRPIGPHWLQLGAADITALGSVTDLGLIVALVAGLFFSLRRWREALILLAATGGGVALSQALKVLYGRERPPMALHAVEVVNASFPSGHAMLTAVVYLTLGALIARFAQKKRVKAFALAGAVVLSLVVGMSRVYLGVHWPTDVLAGWCVGGAWALAWWLLAYIWEKRWPEQAARSRMAERAPER